MIWSMDHNTIVDTTTVILFNDSQGHIMYNNNIHVHAVK